MAGNTINVQGSYIDIHDNETVYLSVDKAQVSLADTPAPGRQTDTGGGTMPAALDTPRARELWDVCKAQGWVDDERQPLLSRTLAAVLADRMAQVLGIRDKWKTFEQAWHRRNMRNDYNSCAREQLQYDDFRKIVEREIR